MLQLSTSTLSSALRALTLFSKFLLLLAMTRFLAQEEIGLYGLLVGAANIAIALISFAFYNYTQRQFMGADPQRQAQLLYYQSCFHLMLYGLFLPLSALVCVAGLLPWSLWIWFVVLTITEHIAAESYRVNLFAKRPIRANVGLFIRAGLWAYLVALFLWMPQIDMQLHDIFWIWLAAVMLSIILQLKPLKELPYRAILLSRIDWSWIKQGVRTSCYYVIAAVTIRAMQYIDLFFIQHFIGLAEVGIYVFYIGIFRAMQSLVQTGISTILLPHIVEAFNAGKIALYKKLQWQTLLGTCISSILVSTAVYLAMDILLAWIDKPDYWQYQSLLYYLIPAVLISCLADVPMHALYVRHKDKLLMLCDLMSFLFFSAVSIWLISEKGLEGAALAVLLSSCFLLVIKIIAAAWVVHREKVR